MDGAVVIILVCFLMVVLLAGVGVGIYFIMKSKKKQDVRVPPRVEPPVVSTPVVKPVLANQPPATPVTSTKKKKKITSQSKKTKKTTTSSMGSASIAPSSRKVIKSKSGVYLQTIYDPTKPSGSQCDLSSMGTTKKTKASPFLFEKQGRQGWIIKTDCDNDGKWTSFLSEDPADLIQIKEKDSSKKARQLWDLSCVNGKNVCYLKNKQTSRYLAMSGTSGTKATTTAKLFGWVLEDVDGEDDAS